MTATPDYCAALAAAEAAYLEMMSGKAVVEFEDQNGERVKYQSINPDKLASYIEGLRRLCDPCYGRRSRPKPIGFLF